MSESGAISMLAIARQHQRARGLARQRAAEDHRLAGPPVEAFALSVRDAVDDDAVVAVDDTVRAVVVDAVDRDVLPRHAGVAAVDDDRLVARAADGEGKRVGGDRMAAFAARLRRQDREARETLPKGEHRGQ